MNKAESIFNFWSLDISNDVLGLLILKSEKILNLPSLTLFEIAIFNAMALIFFGSLWECDLTKGPKITAPPLIWGERLLPCLALPVPFCLKGFLVVPEISEIPLVLWLPERFFANWYLIILWMISSLTLMPNIDLSNSTSLITLSSKFLISCFIFYHLFGLCHLYYFLNLQQFALFYLMILLPDLQGYQLNLQHYSFQLLA